MSRTRDALSPPVLREMNSARFPMEVLVAPESMMMPLSWELLMWATALRPHCTSWSACYWLAYGSFLGFVCVRLCTISPCMWADGLVPIDRQNQSLSSIVSLTVNDGKGPVSSWQKQLLPQGESRRVHYCTRPYHWQQSTTTYSMLPCPVHGPPSRFALMPSLPVTTGLIPPRPTLHTLLWFRVGAVIVEDMTRTQTRSWHCFSQFRCTPEKLGHSIIYPCIVCSNGKTMCIAFNSFHWLWSNGPLSKSLLTPSCVDSCASSKNRHMFRTRPSFSMRFFLNLQLSAGVARTREGTFTCRWSMC